MSAFFFCLFGFFCVFVAVSYEKGEKKEKGGGGDGGGEDRNGEKATGGWGPESEM